MYNQHCKVRSQSSAQHEYPRQYLILDMYYIQDSNGRWGGVYMLVCSICPPYVCTSERFCIGFWIINIDRRPLHNGYQSCRWWRNIFTMGEYPHYSDFIWGTWRIKSSITLLFSQQLNKLSTKNHQMAIMWKALPRHDVSCNAAR